MIIHIFLVEFPTLSLGCEGYISSCDVSAVKSVMVAYFGVTTRSVVNIFCSFILLERSDTGSDPEQSLQVSTSDAKTKDFKPINRKHFYNTVHS